MRVGRQFAAVCMTFITLFPPASLCASDVLLVHGHIYTGNAKAPWAQALAITGTRIDLDGTDEEILARRQSKTEVIDLHGQTVIPGISDSHTAHVAGRDGIALSTPEFSITPDNPDELVEKIKTFAANHPNDKLLIGRSSISHCEFDPRMVKSATIPPFPVSTTDDGYSFSDRPGAPDENLRRASGARR